MFCDDKSKEEQCSLKDLTLIISTTCRTSSFLCFRPILCATTVNFFSVTIWSPTDSVVALGKVVSFSSFLALSSYLPLSLLDVSCGSLLTACLTSCLMVILVLLKTMIVLLACLALVARLLVFYAHLSHFHSVICPALLNS